MDALHCLAAFVHSGPRAVDSPVSEEARATTQDRTRGGKRRAAGWTLLTLGVVVASVWIASGLVRVDWADPSKGWRLQVRNGCVLVDKSAERTGSASWSFMQLEYGYRGFHWTTSWPWSGSGKPDVDLLVFSTNKHSSAVSNWRVWVIALWPIALLLWTSAALLLRSGILARRRALKGSCVKCGYSLTGISANAPCPECGSVAPAAGSAD
ncbi:MAG: hypothetical protein QM783_01570 [Phycisphaerales bacterium]